MNVAERAMETHDPGSRKWTHTQPSIESRIEGIQEVISKLHTELKECSWLIPAMRENLLEVQELVKQRKTRIPIPGRGSGGATISSNDIPQDFTNGLICEQGRNVPRGNKQMKDHSTNDYYYSSSDYRKTIDASVNESNQNGNDTLDDNSTESSAYHIQHELLPLCTSTSTSVANTTEKAGFDTMTQDKLNAQNTEEDMNELEEFSLDNLEKENTPNTIVHDHVAIAAFTNVTNEIHQSQRNLDTFTNVDSVPEIRCKSTKSTRGAKGKWAFKEMIQKKTKRRKQTCSDITEEGDNVMKEIVKPDEYKNVDLKWMVADNSDKTMKRVVDDIKSPNDRTNFGLNEEMAEEEEIKEKREFDEPTKTRINETDRQLCCAFHNETPWPQDMKTENRETNKIERDLALGWETEPDFASAVNNNETITKRDNNGETNVTPTIFDSAVNETIRETWNDKNKETNKTETSFDSAAASKVRETRTSIDENRDTCETKKFSILDANNETLNPTMAENREIQFDVSAVCEATETKRVREEDGNTGQTEQYFDLDVFINDDAMKTIPAGDTKGNNNETETGLGLANTNEASESDTATSRGDKVTDGTETDEATDALPRSLKEPNDLSENDTCAGKPKNAQNTEEDMNELDGFSLDNLENEHTPNTRVHDRVEIAAFTNVTNEFYQSQRNLATFTNDDSVSEVRCKSIKSTRQAKGKGAFNKTIQKKTKSKEKTYSDITMEEDNVMKEFVKSDEHKNVDLKWVVEASESDTATSRGDKETDGTETDEATDVLQRSLKEPNDLSENDTCAGKPKRRFNIVDGVKAIPRAIILHVCSLVRFFLSFCLVIIVVIFYLFAIIYMFNDYSVLKKH